jgi:hypothetical protein
MPLKPGKAASPSFLNSNSQHVLEDLDYTKEDVQHIIDWVKRTFSLIHSLTPILSTHPSHPLHSHSHSHSHPHLH